MKKTEKGGMKEARMEMNKTKEKGREEGRKEERKKGRKEGRKEGRKKGRKKGRKEGRKAIHSRYSINTFIYFVIEGKSEGHSLTSCRKCTSKRRCFDH